MSSLPSIPEKAESLVVCAQTHIQVLAEKIGPRPAGSVAERQSMDYLSGLLSQWGYRVQREGVAFAPTPLYNLPYLIGAAALGVAGWMSTFFPWVALALPFLLMVLPQWSRQWVQSRKPTSCSENLLAELDRSGRSSPPSLLLCAHVDTARALPLREPRLLRIYSRTMDILQRFAWMIFAVALLQAWGWQVAQGLIYAVAGLGSLGAFWLAALQLSPLVRSEELSYSPGANDNASGVGVLLAIAEQLAEREGVSNSIAFLFTTAEEGGLYGARDFICNHLDWARTTAVVCLDMVGQGDHLYYVVKEGVFKPLQTSLDLQNALRQANPSIQPLWHTLRSGDYAAFCQAGFHAIGLESGGKSLADWRYHSIYDTVDGINPQMLREVLQTVLILLENYTEKSNASLI